MKDVACEEWGWVSGRVVSLCNIGATKVTEFVSSVSARALGSITGDEEGSNSMSSQEDLFVYHNSKRTPPSYSCHPSALTGCVIHYPCKSQP